MNKKTLKNKALIGRVMSVFVLFSVFFMSCAELQKPVVEPFYGKNEPPKLQEFRWSNGKTPKTFDPAKSTAPPETDLVRAVYEGLTDADAKTLEITAAIATKWETSQAGKVWTFRLRKNAKWTNGENVTAKDFVQSWKRIAEIGEKSPNYKLFANIVGFEQIQIDKLKAQKEAAEKKAKLEKKESNGAKNEVAKIEPPKIEENKNETPILPADKAKDVTTATNAAKTEEKKEVFTSPNSGKNEVVKNAKKDKPKAVEFGVKEIDAYTLQVTLINADKDFPALVAHTAFRPIYGDGAEFDKENLPAQVPTNGAFRLFSVGKDGIVLEKSALFWDKEKIQLDRVKFVPTENAESALAAYRLGKLDAMTNAHFQPLAVKLIAPYNDFKRTTHSALNLYEFNRLRKPFDDQRVREALTIAFDRQLITTDAMDGASEPAGTFLLKPVKSDEVKTELKIAQNVEKARELLTEAGFPNGENFPNIRLLVNRNDLQKRVANAVSKMWEKNLGIKTEIIYKDWEEYEKARIEGDFDLIRRGVVLPTLNETANLAAIFEMPKTAGNLNTETNEAAFETTSTVPTVETQVSPSPTPEILPPTSENAPVQVPAEPILSPVNGENTVPNEIPKTPETPKPILTESDAMQEFPAIPLYFATSQSLIKPYVRGFETNLLDAPSLKDVSIDTTWQPPKNESNWLSPAK